jgi:hypothetical protein
MDLFESRLQINMRECQELTYEPNRLLGLRIYDTPHTVAVFYVDEERLSYKLPDTNTGFSFGFLYGQFDVSNLSSI